MYCHTCHDAQWAAVGRCSVVSALAERANGADAGSGAGLGIDVRTLLAEAATLLPLMYVVAVKGQG